MPEKEAVARIKINKLLEAAGWRFFPAGGQAANIRLEPTVTIKSADLDALGTDFENSQKGFVDFLLLDDRGFPLLVLEAKALFDYIEVFYNQRRRHSTLGLISPAEFERRNAQAA